MTPGQKIIFCDQFGQPGGGQQVLMELCRTAIADGLKPAVLMPAGQCLEELRKLGLQCEEIPAFSLPKKTGFNWPDYLNTTLAFFLKKLTFYALPI